MKEDADARLAKAAMQSLLVSAPESLKADLKRRARNRKTAPGIWDALLNGFSGGTWAYGAGAVFAAAAIGIFMLRVVPERQRARGVALQSAAHPEIISPQSLRDMWSDDDGADHDEI